jgi:hypothetical protein
MLHLKKLKKVQYKKNRQENNRHVKMTLVPGSRQHSSDGARSWFRGGARPRPVAALVRGFAEVRILVPAADGREARERRRRR